MLCTCPYHRASYDDAQHAHCPACRREGRSIAVCQPGELERVRALMATLDCCEEAGAYVVVMFRGFTAQATLPPPVAGVYSLQQLEAATEHRRLTQAQRRAMEEAAA